MTGFLKLLDIAEEVPRDEPMGLTPSEVRLLAGLSKTSVRGFVRNGVLLGRRFVIIPENWMESS